MTRTTTLTHISFLIATTLSAACGGIEGAEGVDESAARTSGGQWGPGNFGFIAESTNTQATVVNRGRKGSIATWAGTSVYATATLRTASTRQTTSLDIVSVEELGGTVHVTVGAAKGAAVGAALGAVTGAGTSAQIYRFVDTAGNVTFAVSNQGSASQVALHIDSWSIGDAVELSLVAP